MNNHLLLKQRYQVQETLGQGSFGITYRALDWETNQSCVIKCLSLTQAESWETVELFEREARILAHLNHPRIPKFVDSFKVETEQDVKIYLVQEYIEGKSLAQWIQEGKHFTEKEVLTMALDVTKILEYLHGFSPPIIHRDIKPGNIVLTPDKKVSLIDFGAVRDKILHDKMRHGGGSTIVGTYGYMPLEQFEGRAVPASDLYSLGATLIYVLSHKEPGQMGKEGMRLDFRPHVHISRDFARVLEKMIEPDWEKRYQTVSRLREKLETLLAGGTWVELIEPYIKQIVSGMAILLLLGVGWYTFFQDRTTTKIPLKEVLKLDEEDIKLEAEDEKKGSRQLIISTPQEGPGKQAGTNVIQGRLLFEGQLITNFTQERPSFWFRNEDIGKEQKAEVNYDKGRFYVYGLPTGHFGLNIYLNANRENLAGYPGDFYVWKTFHVVEGTNPELVVDLQRVIHLVSPQDNGTVLELWDAPCGKQIAFNSPVRFAWESLGNIVSYSYDILRVTCPYTSRDTQVSSTISDTQVVVELPPSQENEFYVFHLYARKDGRNIGILTTHGSNGIAWDYRFRVVSPSSALLPGKLKPELVVAQNGKIPIDLYRDFKFVAQGWPLGLSVGQTSAGGLDYKPYETLIREPLYRSPEVLYGYFELGNGDDSRITFVIDELEQPTWRLYVDKNNNEDLTDDGPPYSNQGTLKLATNVSLDIDIMTSTSQKMKQPYKLWFWVNEFDGKKWPRFYATGHYMGQISIDGQLYKAIVFEEFDHNGLYRESGLWIDLNKDGKLSKETEHFEDGEVIQINQKRYQVELNYP
jgi:serine/threonine protein kinase